MRIVVHCYLPKEAFELKTCDSDQHKQPPTRCFLFFLLCTVVCYSHCFNLPQASSVIHCAVICCGLLSDSSTHSLISDSSTHSESSDLPEAPPNTRSSSPQPTREESDGRLPHAEQVAQEFQSVAAPWIEVSEGGHCGNVVSALYLCVILRGGYIVCDTEGVILRNGCIVCDPEGWLHCLWYWGGDTEKWLHCVWYWGCGTEGWVQYVWY